MGLKLANLQGLMEGGDLVYRFLGPMGFCTANGLSSERLVEGVTSWMDVVCKGINRRLAVGHI